jgi:hemerythrin
MALTWQDELSVGIAGMDQHHRAFLDLLARLNEASPMEFADLFQQFLDHLAEHFAYEEGLMEQHGFPALKDHRGEHLRVLAEAREMGRSLARGGTSLIRHFVRSRVPEWFLLHRNTMDLATAAFLRERGINGEA